MKTTRSLKTVAFALGLAAMTLPATTLNAQGRPGGLFGSNAPTEQPQGGLMGNRSGSTGAYKITVEQFGGENGGGEGGFNIGTEQFGAPLGSGLFIMAAAGAAYAFSKKRKKQENN
jgi:hypothetical protein